MHNIIDLSEMTEDALVEVFNIGVSRAATSLSRLTKHNVDITVPKLEFMERTEMIEYAIENLGGQVTALGIEFDGSLQGHIQLLLPSQFASPIASLLLKANGIENPDRTFLEDSLKETGNILLNACLGSIANALELRFNSRPPQLVLQMKPSTDFDFDADDFCLDWQFSDLSLGVLLQMDMHIDINNMATRMMMYLELPTITAFNESLKKYIKRLLDQ